MKKIIGVISLVIGVLLLVWGHNIAQSVDSQVKQIFTGAPTDRATYYYIARRVARIVRFVPDSLAGQVEIIPNRRSGVSADHRIYLENEIIRLSAESRYVRFAGVSK